MDTYSQQQPAGFTFTAVGYAHATSKKTGPHAFADPEARLAAQQSFLRSSPRG
jgi:hypothetical protein